MLERDVVDSTRQLLATDEHGFLGFGVWDLVDAAEAALGPLGGDEGVDKRELVGIGGAEVSEGLSVRRFELICDSPLCR